MQDCQKLLLTTKHKQNSKTPENIRDSNLDEALQLFMPPEEKRDTVNIHPYEEEKVVEVHVKCEYWQCKFSSNDKIEIENHISKNHVVDESFIYPSSSEELECPDCDKLFLADHTYARQVYEEHLYSFTCSHCNKYLPNEDEMAGIHYKMCQAPCDGHPLCLCKM